MNDGAKGLFCLQMMRLQSNSAQSPSLTQIQWAVLVGTGWEQRDSVAGIVVVAAAAATAKVAVVVTIPLAERVAAALVERVAVEAKTTVVDEEIPPGRPLAQLAAGTG